MSKKKSNQTLRIQVKNFSRIQTQFFFSFGMVTKCVNEDMATYMGLLEPVPSQVKTVQIFKKRKKMEVAIDREHCQDNHKKQKNRVKVLKTTETMK